MHQLIVLYQLRLAFSLESPMSYGRAAVDASFCLMGIHELTVCHNNLVLYEVLSMQGTVTDLHKITTTEQRS